MGQGFFVGVRHASNHNDESFQTSALELRLDQVKHESEQLRLNILEKDKIIDGKAAAASEVLVTDRVIPQTWVSGFWRSMKKWVFKDES